MQILPVGVAVPRGHAGEAATVVPISDGLRGSYSYILLVIAMSAAAAVIDVRRTLRADDCDVNRGVGMVMGARLTPSLVAFRRYSKTWFRWRRNSFGRSQ